MIAINLLGMVPKCIFNGGGDFRDERTVTPTTNSFPRPFAVRSSQSQRRRSMPGPCAVCNQASIFICGGCKLVYYCGKSHQKLHWKEYHKGNCQPKFKLEENEKLGRFLVAARDIREGEVILQESPLMLGPKSVSTPVCLGCHAPCHPQRYHECDGCGFALCSPKCQVSDFHIDECRLMMKAKFRAKMDPGMSKKEILYFPIVPLRCLLLKETDPDKYNKISNLQSHLQERLHTPLYQLYRKNVVEFLRDRLSRKDFLEEDIFNVLAILDTNAFEIRRKPKLRGLYNTSSMLAHDCTPNTTHSFLEPEFTIVLTATTDISRGDILSTTYTHTFWGTLSRREHLKAVKCFDCDCRRCKDPTELATYLGAIRCTRCVSPDNPAPYILSTAPLDPNAPWQCDNCAHVIPSKHIRAGNDDLNNDLSCEGAVTADSLTRFLDKYNAPGPGVLHPRNYHVLQAKHALIQLYGNRHGFSYSELSDELLQKKIDFCHELLGVVDVLEPGSSRIRGEILNELQATMVVQARRQFSQQKITEDAAQEILGEALAILKEAMQILRLELDPEDSERRLTSLGKGLDN